MLISVCPLFNIFIPMPESIILKLFWVVPMNKKVVPMPIEVVQMPFRVVPMPFRVVPMPIRVVPMDNLATFLGIRMKFI
jgi:hypothetical protein